MSPPAYDTVLVVVASVSVGISLTVVLSLTLFREMRNKFFMQIIAFISISDAVGNFPYMLPYRPPSGSWWCTLQGMINFTAYPMSWLWTLSLVYHLYQVATNGALPSKRMIRFTHLVCWGLPMALSLGGLSVTHFVRSEPIAFEVCEIDSVKAAIYHGIAYYGLLLAVLTFLGILSYNTYSLERLRDVHTFHPSYSILKASVSLYPTSLVICWVPHLVLFALYPIEQTNFLVYEKYYFCTTLTKIIHGSLTAGIFFYKSKSARNLWKKLFRNTCCRCFYGDSDRLLRTSNVSFDGDNPIELSLQYDRNYSHSTDSTIRNTIHSVTLA